MGCSNQQEKKILQDVKHFISGKIPLCLKSFVRIKLIDVVVFGKEARDILMALHMMVPGGHHVLTTQQEKSSIPDFFGAHSLKEHKAYWALKHTNFDLKTAGDHRKVQLNELNELRDEAYENSLIYKEKTKRIHDSKIKNRVFNVGDRVLLFNSRLKIFSGKLKTRWSGPFTITQVFPYGTVELSQNSGPNFKVNGHRIKHYFGGDVPQLVSDLLTFPKCPINSGDGSKNENGLKTSAYVGRPTQAYRDCPDCEDSRALSFIFHSQEFRILSFILGIQYPNLID
ncbi:hypothetical protein Tco_0739809 [Tanacetum coccineum]